MNAPEPFGACRWPAPFAITHTVQRTSFLLTARPSECVESVQPLSFILAESRTRRTERSRTQVCTMGAVALYHAIDAYAGTFRFNKEDHTLGNLLATYVRLLSSKQQQQSRSAHRSHISDGCLKTHACYLQVITHLFPRQSHAGRLQSSAPARAPHSSSSANNIR